MDYSAAKSIRGTKLSSLIADKIISGGSIGSSIKGALSDRMKAKAMGAKERYDPLNIAKKLTGGSSLAPALLGRMMGRSKEDISYFAGKGTATALGHETGNIGGGSVDVLNRILAFLQKSHEIDTRTMEVKKNFQEETMNEDERRHQEFLKALKEFTSGGTATTIINNYGNGEDGDSSIFDVLDNIRRPGSGGGKGRSGKSRLRKLTEKSGRGLRSVGRLAGIYGAFLAPFMIAAEDKEKIDADPYNPAWKDNPYAMKVQSELEGGNMTQGQAGQKNMRSAMRRMVDQSAKNMETYPSTSDTSSALPAGNSTAGAGRGSAEFAKTDPRLIKQPVSSGVSEATNANIDLNLEQSMPSGGASTPIVTNNTNNMGNQKSPASTTASQRDSTDILLHIYGALNKAGFI